MTKQSLLEQSVLRKLYYIMAEIGQHFFMCYCFIIYFYSFNNSNRFRPKMTVTNAIREWICSVFYGLSTKY